MKKVKRGKSVCDPAVERIRRYGLKGMKNTLIDDVRQDREGDIKW